MNEEPTTVHSITVNEGSISWSNLIIICLKRITPFILGILATIIIYEKILIKPISITGTVKQDEPDEPSENRYPPTLPYINTRIYLKNIPLSLIGKEKGFTGKIYYHEISPNTYCPVMNVNSHYQIYSIPPH